MQKKDRRESRRSLVLANFLDARGCYRPEADWAYPIPISVDSHDIAYHTATMPVSASTVNRQWRSDRNLVAVSRILVSSPKDWTDAPRAFIVLRGTECLFQCILDASGGGHDTSHERIDRSPTHFVAVSEENIDLLVHGGLLCPSKVKLVCPCYIA
jgi:hypothetical protein